MNNGIRPVRRGQARTLLQGGPELRPGRNRCTVHSNNLGPTQGQKVRDRRRQILNLRRILGVVAGEDGNRLGRHQKIVGIGQLDSQPAFATDLALDRDGFIIAPNDQGQRLAFVLLDQRRHLGSPGVIDVAEANDDITGQEFAEVLAFLVNVCNTHQRREAQQTEVGG